MSRIPEGYIFENKRNETLIKLPNSINEQVFNIQRLENCTVYILDVSSTIFVDNCNDCRFFVGPVTDSFFLRDSRNCECSVACKQMRVKNCNEVIFFLYSKSDPHIEASFDMKFAPYNFSYPNQREDFRRVGFNPNENRWCKVYDHSSSEGDGHFSLLPPNRFKKEEKKLDGLPSPDNPVPIPKQYGGDLAEDIVPGSISQNRPEVRALNRPEIAVNNVSENAQPKSPVRNEPMRNDPMRNGPMRNEPVRNEPVRTEAVNGKDDNKTDIMIFYEEGTGFSLGNIELPRQFSREELGKKITQYNDAGREYFTQWTEHIFAIFLAVIGFLVILLLMSLLKMSSEWSLPALGLFLVIIIGSLVAILVVQIIRVKKLENSWISAVQEISLQQNSQYFETKNSTIHAGLTSLTISISSP